MDLFSKKTYVEINLHIHSERPTKIAFKICTHIYIDVETPTKAIPICSQGSVHMAHVFLVKMQHTTEATHVHEHNKTQGD